ISNLYSLSAPFWYGAPAGGPPPGASARAPLLGRRRVERRHIVPQDVARHRGVIDEPEQEDDRDVAELQLLDPVVDGMPLRLIDRAVGLLEKTVHLRIAVALVVFARGARILGDIAGVPVDLVFREHPLSPGEEQRRIFPIPLGAVLAKERRGAHRAGLRVHADRPPGLRDQLHGLAED